MERPVTILAAELAIVLLLALVAVPLLAAQDSGAFLTGPAVGKPEEIALGYIDKSKGDLGLSSGDLADLVVKDQYISQHNGVTHIYFQQRLDGIEIVNGLINVNVMRDGRILNIGNRFVGNLAKAVSTRSPDVQVDEAIRRAAEHLEVELRGSLDLLELVGGPAMEVIYSGAGVSRDDIPAKLMYLPSRDGGGVRLVWSLVIRQTNTSDWWNLFVDAVTGEVLEKFSWTRNESYEVFALPKESPLNGPRTIEDDPFDPTASPLGWHDTDGVPGPEFTDTRGNNVEAQTDLDANDSFTPGTDVRAEGGASLDFIGPAVPLDLNLPPEAYREAATANLFYYNNIMHDVTYQYGFDEAAGNFQQNNYGNGGAGGDPVQADAQDGSGCANANFGTPPDGSDPRMQMFIWNTVPNGRVTVNGGPAAGDYDAAKGCWGGALVPVTTADLEPAEDGTGNNEGCNALIGFTPGNIALIDRGTCEFGTKALNAENAGATGAIIVNDQQLPNDIIAMGAGEDSGSVTIPAVMIGNADGTTIRNELPGVNATIQPPAAGGDVDRDSDLDNGIMGHEYGHGISNRLVGGPAQAGCLQNDEQAGEGWSDFWTLVLSALPSHTPQLARGIGNYVIFEPENGPGIRNFPYSTSLFVNPQTYADIGTTNIPHGVGEIWMTAVWEVYWLLVQRDGFDTDFYNGTGGNNLAIQLVIDGMKMTACSPSFVDARDGILAADLATFGGANQCEIWAGFAKRGLGFSADAGDPLAVGDETEAFDLPPFCDTVGALPDSLDICQGQTATYLVGVGSSFPNPPVTMSSTGEPAGATTSFTPNPVSGPLPTTSTFEVSNTGAATPGSYNIMVTGTDTTPIAFNTNVSLNVFGANATAPLLVAPPNGAIDLPSLPTFEWLASPEAVSYTLEIDDDPGFGSIDYSVSGLVGLTHTPTNELQFDTTYFWRVRSENPCGAGPNSSVFSFTTMKSPALCPPGFVPVVHFEDDLESGAAGWTSGGTGNTWALSNTRFTSPGNAFHALDPESESDQRLVSPPIVLPMSESPLTLQFQNYQAFETPNGDGRCWDAGILELTTDGGATWDQVPGTAMLTDPYDNIIWNDTPGNNPISDDHGAAEAWCDEQQPFVLSVVDLDAYAGNTVQFRWRLGSDGNTGNEGWYLDDVLVQSCFDATIFLDGFESGDVSAWSRSVP